MQYPVVCVIRLCQISTIDRLIGLFDDFAIVQRKHEILLSGTSNEWKRYEIYEMKKLYSSNEVDMFSSLLRKSSRENLFLDNIGL